MKFLCRALCVLFIAICAVRAAQEEESPLGDFAPLDDDLVLYIPKFAVKLGFRGIGGVKTGFGGKGVLFSTTELDGSTGVANRRYHDGYVLLDSRTVFDPSGNTVPITPDGRTNTWAFLDPTQATDDGLIAMHSYSVSTTDSSFTSKDPGTAFGVELSLDREIGNVFGTKMKWGVVGGVSINQIYSTTSGSLTGDVTTITDKYSLGGQAAPTAPFTGPTFGGSVDTTPLLGSELLERTTTVVSTPGAMLSTWKVRGAYMTFRAGASLWVPITGRFSAQVSAGPVLVYAGSTYDVTQTFKPNTGDSITQYISDGDSKILPGFYVDASLQFAMNDTAGLYLGAVYQSSGDYEQEALSDDGNSKYSTRIDLSSLQGIRAGVSFKF
jgi:hypothetical protein